MKLFITVLGLSLLAVCLSLPVGENEHKNSLEEVDAGVESDSSVEHNRLARSFGYGGLGVYNGFGAYGGIGVSGGFGGFGAYGGHPIVYGGYPGGYVGFPGGYGVYGGYPLGIGYGGGYSASASSFGGGGFYGR